uniref:Mucosal addressin cell adhesion molecule 1 n=1 Tax=Castor canadensis TaxID=51338 RepID=A0A8C0X5W8_CASCN
MSLSLFCISLYLICLCLSLTLCVCLSLPYLPHLSSTSQLFACAVPSPVVVVAMGGSCQLTCSLSCKDGEVATVQWRGLDTRLGAVQSSAGNSVLSIHQAALSDTGTRVCVGSCGGRHNFQHSVQILVYAFPDQLVVSPTALVLGQDQEVSCTAHNVTPAGQDTLSFTLLLGDQELEGVQVLGRKEEEEPQEVEDPLFQVTKRWLLPALGSPAPPVLFCQATMRLPGLEMSHYRVVQPTAALWMGSLVLGLLLLALLTYSLWKRWRPSAEDHTHLPTPLRLLPLTD